MRSITRFVPDMSAWAAQVAPRLRVFTGLALIGVLLGFTPAPADAQQLPQVQEPDPENIENMFSIGVMYWRPDKGTTGFFGGKPSLDPDRQKLFFPDPPARATGFEITIPTGGFNRLEIGYWSLKDSGQSRARRDLDIFGAIVDPDEGINQRYDLKNVRIAWNYLTYPVPALDSRFRLKTFWEFQYTRLDSVVSFPDSATESGLIPTVNPKQSVKLPGVGIGAEFIPTRAFRVEGRISGMGLPNRSRYLDAQVTAVGRIAGFIEIFGGYKGFHYRTSPREPQFIEGTVAGPVGGIRFLLN